MNYLELPAILSSYSSKMSLRQTLKTIWVIDLKPSALWILLLSLLSFQKDSHSLIS